MILLVKTDYIGSNGQRNRHRIYDSLVPFDHEIFDRTDIRLLGSQHDILGVRRGFVPNKKHIGHTNTKSGSYWDFEPRNETGLNDRYEKLIRLPYSCMWQQAAYKF